MAKKEKTTSRTFRVVKESYINEAIVPEGATVTINVTDDFIPGENLEEVTGKKAAAEVVDDEPPV